MPGLERFTADEVDLSTMAWNISAVTAATPGLRGSDLELPGRDGVIHVPNRAVETGELSLTMWVLGANSDGSVPATRSLRRGLFEQNLHRLLALLTNKSRPIIIRRYLASETVYREAKCLAADSTSPQTMMARQRAEFTAVFDIMDSYWRSSASVTAGTSGTATTKNLDFTAAAGMSAPVQDAVATVTGPATNPRITNPESGVWVQLQGSLSAGQQWIVDSGAWTSKIGAADAPVTHGGHPRYLYIAPRNGNSFTPRLTLQASSGTQMTVTFFPRWATL